MIEQNKYFETRYKFEKKRTVVWRAIAEYLQHYINENSSILEIGAGYCDFRNQIKVKEKYAIDSNSQSKAYAAKDVSFINVSINEFSINKKFDYIFASNFFEHFTIEELQIIIPKLKDLLTNNGKIIIIQPNYFYAYRNYWDDYTHKTAFSHSSLSDFFVEQGFKMLQVKKKFLPFSFKSKLPASYFLTKLYLSSPIKPFAKQFFIIAEKDVQE